MLDAWRPTGLQTLHAVWSESRVFKKIMALLRGEVMWEIAPAWICHCSDMRTAPPLLPSLLQTTDRPLAYQGRSRNRPLTFRPPALTPSGDSLLKSTFVVPFVAWLPAPPQGGRGGGASVRQLDTLAEKNQGAIEGA